MTVPTKTLQIVNGPQTCLAVCHCCIKEMLSAILGHGKPLERQVTGGPVLGCHLSRQKHGALEGQLLNAAFDQFDLEGYDSSLSKLATADNQRIDTVFYHFDGATEADLSITLTKVKIANGELGSFDMDRQKRL